MPNVVEPFDGTVDENASSNTTALVFGDRRVSYGEFGARVNVLARQLIAAGVGPDVAVAVAMPRSPEMLVAIHAVTAAGGHYVPVDVDAPGERVEYMLTTSGAKLALVASGQPPVEGLGAAQLIEVDTTEAVDPASPEAATVTDADRITRLRADDAAYTLFTSGSTGRPKGVTVSHRAIVNRLEWMRDWYGLTDADVFLQKTPATFDVSVWELFLPLALGATLVIAEPDRHGDPTYIADVVDSERVTAIHFVPSMLSAFVDVLGERLTELTTLRRMFTSGEALTASVSQSVLAALPQMELHNLYGPTEAAVDVTAQHVRAEDPTVPIGVPVPETTTFVLDPRLQLVPRGVPGELYLGGVQLARGYAARPDLTAERFVADPFGEAGDRLYRTGDLVRWNSSGRIEYLGRTDFQVKLRGQRLELGEVESVIAAAPGVVHAAAAVAKLPAGDQLVAYVAPGTVDLDSVKASVAAALPEYMRPTVWMTLDEMPLNTAGKVARRRLPAPEITVAAYVAPEGGVQTRLAEVYASVLGTDRVSAAESFFDLGGNSLAATRLAARIADALDIDVTVRDIFDAPSVRELADALVGRGRQVEALAARERPARIPLSTAQQRMWFINQFDTASPAYNIPMGLRLRGDLDLGALHQALGDVIERHEVLRTVYPSDEQGPTQAILSADEARTRFEWLETDDLSGLVESASRGFDVSGDLPIRGAFRRATEDDAIDLVLTAHHIAFDGESTPVFVRDLLGAYLRRTGADVPDQRPLEVQYADFALWQRHVLGGARDASSPIGRQLTYWRDQLVDLPAVTDLPMDRPRPAVLDNAAALVSVDVDEALAAGIDRLARSHQATGFMVTHAALAIAVARLAATSDVVIGSPIAGRTDAALEDLVGMFVNTLVLRTPVDSAQSVGEFLDEVRRVDLDAFANADAQFDDLIEELAPERSTSHQPLVQIAFSHVAAGGRPELVPVTLPGLSAEPLATADPVAKFDLTVEVTEAGENTPMTVRFLYATSLFDESTVRRFADAWLQTVAAMITDPAIATGDIDLVGVDSPTTVSRNSVGGTEPAADGGVSVPVPLPDLLAARAADPGHTALVCDGEELTYGEFERRTDAVARALIGRGVTPDDIVAIGLERSIGSVVSVFGVIKSGAAYVPIDPAYPQDRIDYMVADSGVRLGITDAPTRERLGDGECEWLDVADLTVGAAEPVTASDRNGVLTVDNLAYLVYTSGSTGKPKAVGVSHRGLANFIDQFREVSGEHGQAPDTRVLHVASPSFDASVLEMMWSIGLGHTLVIAPASEYAGEALGRVLERDRVTDTLITPTVLATVDPVRGSSIRNLVTGGEACPPELIAKWAGADAPAGRTMYNFYGPSEATVWSLTGRSMAGQPVTIGHPVRGFSAHVLDSRLHPVPQGVVGELYLASDASLARGYLGRPGQTAGAFVADPFSRTPGARMYATGDMVRVNTRGEIEFAGRADDQVKINGQRVELGEIEAVLADLPAIDSAVVTGIRDDSGRSRLVAYLVPVAGAEVVVDEVLAAAGNRLAAHMVPHVAVVLDELPLTPGGKLDRRALPNPEFTIEDADLVAPASAAEETLAAIVSGLLGRDRVSVNESFFAMGGDSIMSIQLASAARAADLELTPREIFEHKTIRSLARVAVAGGERLPMIVEPADATGQSVLSPIVSWLVDAAPTAADLADFNQAMVLNAPADITVDRLGQVLAAVVEAHPMLSASLTGTDDGWTMSVGGTFDPTTSVTEIDADDLAEAIVRAHAADAAKLDPETGDVVRGSLVRTAEAARIVLTIHHLAIDAVSWPILIEDLVTAWSQLSDGRPVEVRPEISSVRAWNAALAEHAHDRQAESAYWLERSPLTQNSLGTDFDPARDVYSATESIVHTVETAVAAPLITSVPDAFHGAPTDAMLAALGRAVRDWQRSRGIADDAPVVVLSEGHGRYEDVLADATTPTRADLSRTVGWFTSIAPVLVDPSHDAAHAVKAVKEERLHQPGHGVGYGLLRYRDGSPLATRPLPSIAFNYLGGSGAAAGTSEASAPTSEVGFLPAAGAPFLPSTMSGRLAAMAPLVINASTVAGPDGAVLSADFRYTPAVLTAQDVRTIAENWTRELEAIVRASSTDVGLSPSDVPGSGITQNDLDAIADRQPGADVWPLTPLQRGLYFQSQLAGSAAVDVYVTQAVLHLGGEVDVDRLRTATRDLLAHHSALRSAFVQTASGAVVGVVPPEVDVPWRTVDLPAFDADSASAEVARIAAEEKLAPFDMAVAPLLRIVLVEHADGASVVITNHHILFDGWSGPLVMADLLALYATGATYTGLNRSADAAALDFADYARRIGRADHAAGIAAWRDVLAPITEPTFVAADTEATVDAMPRDLRVSLGTDMTEAVEALSRRTGATVATVLQFAWAVLMSRYTGNRVVTFGETVSGRPADLDGVESMVGLFINTLPVVVDVDPAASATDVLAALQADKVKVLDHQHIGLPELTALTGLPSLFDTLTVYESYPVDTDSLASADTTSVGVGLQIRGAEVTDATHYPLNLGAAPTADGILLTVKYLPTAFSDRQAQTFVDALTQILRTITRDAARRIGDIPVVADGHLADVVLTEPAPAVPPKRVVDMIADRDIDPAHPAIIDGDQVITYADFEARTNRVARALIAKGVGPEDIVAVVLDRSVESVTAVWGTVKTGAAFVAIDPAHPDDRIAGMLDDTASRYGITVPEHTARLAEFGTEWLDVDQLAAADVDDSDLTDADRNGVVRLDNLAYLIFTSGTTGRPKAAANLNRGLATMADRLAQITGTRDDHESTRILHLSSPSFDASFFEMIWALGAGHTMVISPASVYAGPALDAILREHAITDLVLTPSVLATLDVSNAVDLRNLIVCGEPCPLELVDRWAGAGKAMFNFYGPSEATVISSTAILEPAKPVTVGTSVRGFTGYVLDERLQPVPHGFIGELYLSAPQGLGRGYLKRFGLTAERFVADPFVGDGSRMYATGDLVRINDDAELEFAGRADFQVKIAGQRIELGEIEAVLADLSGVASAVVVGAGTPAKSLAAYVVAEESADLSVDELRDGLRQRVPSFMVPSSIMLIDAIPINAVGKLDRRALPEPEVASVEYVAPASAEEEAVAGVFADVLGVDSVGVTVGFFELGGNSLSATRLVARVSDALGVEVSVRDVFGAPTVRALVKAVAGRGAALEAVSAVHPRPGRIPLSFAQQRIWFINQLSPMSAAYNVPAVVRLSGHLDAEALHAAILDVVVRHETLRTTFPSTDGQAYQLIHSPERARELVDWAVVDEPVEIERAVTTGFALGNELPIRGRLLRVSPDEHVLALVAHHIAADGESVAPLVGDLITAYAARADGRAPTFIPLEVQYADYALWQHRVLGDPADQTSVLGKQLAYWTRQLAGVPDLLELPADRPRPAVASQTGAELELAIPLDIATRIKQLASESDVTSFMVVHAALAVLLSRLAATDDIVIATPVAGRGQTALDPLVGMFVNTLVLRTPIDSNARFTDVVDLVRSVDVEAYANTTVPFEVLVDAVNPIRSESFSPIAQVMLSFVEGGGPQGEVRLDGLTMEPIGADVKPAQFDLSVTVAASADQPWKISVIYATDLFDQDTVEAFGRRLVVLLDALTAAGSSVVGDVDLMSSSEREALAVHEVGPTPAVATEDLATAVHSRLAAAPDGVALIHGDRTMTNREFGARVATVARELIAAGIGPETPVGVCFDRSIAMMIGIHAVLAAGGHYVPIDPDAPRDRVDYMVDVAGIGHVVTALGQVPPVIASLVDARIVEIDSTSAVDLATSPVGAAERRTPLLLDSAAYTLFTSGSTGRPKGVTVTHRAIVNRLDWMARDYSISSEDVFLQKTPTTFDVSVWELILPMLVGAPLVIAEHGRHGDPEYIADVIGEHGVTLVHFVPSMLAAFEDVLGDRLSEMATLRLMFTSGEALTPTVAQTVLRALPAIDLHNLYGPTEAAVDVTAHQVAAGEQTVPIGTPVDGTITRVLDSRLHPVPVGVPGELYLGGVQLARGYAGRGALTAERFVADPFGEPGDRIYRTGDLVRWTDAGEIDYLGRTDFQVKLRGQRLELGEVESVLASVPGVVHAAAAVQELRGGKHLVAYLAPATVDVETVQAAVSEALPAYMVPTIWMPLDVLALNSAGKIDRKALPAPLISTTDVEYVAPETPIEEAIAAVYADVLGVDRISAASSFFDVGGNSLSATRVRSRLHERNGLEIELSWLFSDPSPRALAARIAKGNEETNDVLIALRKDGSRPPLFCIHPAGGLAWFYGGLLPYLPDRPVYGLQDPHVVAGEPAFTDVAEMAARYVDEMRKVQSEGPYRILGWSVGGVIAFAMANQLEQAGESVAYLGVMDAQPDDPESIARAVARDPSAGEVDTDDVMDVLGGWRSLFDLGDDVTADTPEALTELIRTQITGMGLFGADQVDRIMDSFMTAGEVALTLRPEPFAGGIQVFVATADKAEPGAMVDAWRPLVSVVNEQFVDTHHLGMTDAASLAVIGPRLAAALAEADV